MSLEIQNRFRKRLFRMWYSGPGRSFIELFGYSPSQVFVMGNQKSGTTVVAALLGKAAHISVSLDFQEEIPDPTFQLAFTGEISGREYILKYGHWFLSSIVKEPNMTFLWPLIDQSFPETKFVFVQRDPRDNIRSILNRHNIQGTQFSLENQQVVNLYPAWKVIFDGSWLGIQEEDIISVLAHRWVIASENYQRFQNKTRLVRYEDFLKDKEETIKDLLKETGLMYRHSIADKVNVQYQRKGTRSVNWEEFFGKENLDCINSICGEKMKDFGYNPEALTPDESIQIP